MFAPKDRGKLSKRIIPHRVQKLITMKIKRSKCIKKTKCCVRISSLRKEYMELEDTLKESYERFRYKKELEIIGNLKENPSIFYMYAHRKAVVQSNVGPLKYTG